MLHTPNSVVAPMSNFSKIFCVIRSWLETNSECEKHLLKHFLFLSLLDFKTTLLKKLLRVL